MIPGLSQLEAVYKQLVTFDRVDLKTALHSDRRKAIILGIIVSFLSLLTIVPLVFLLWTSVWSGFPGEMSASFTLAHYRRVYLGEFFDVTNLLKNSLIIASGMTGTGLVIGVSTAWLFVRTNVPTKGWMEMVLLSCQTIPGYVYAIMYVTTYGPGNGFLWNALSSFLGTQPLPLTIYNPWGMAFVAGINIVPTFYLLTVPAFQDMDPALEEVSRIHGAGIFQTVRTISLPLVKPAILSATIVAFLFGLGEFAVVSMLGAKQGFEVYSTAVQGAIKGSFPPAYGEAAALSSSLLLIMIVFVWYYRKVTSRKQSFMTLTGRESGSSTWDLGHWRWPVALLLWCLLFAVWILPIGGLVATSLQSTWTATIIPKNITLGNYITVLSKPALQHAFLNSMAVAIGGATLGTVLVVGTAYYTERSDGPLTGIVDFLTLTPLAVPGIVTGAALLFMFLWLGNLHPLLDFYGSLWVIILGSVLVYIPVSSRIAIGNIVQIHSSLEEAGRLAGATWVSQIREIFLPLFKNTVTVIWFFLALHIVQLLSIPLMTYSSDSIVIPVKLFQSYLYSSDLGLVSAMSMMFILMTVALLAVLHYLGFAFYDLE